MEERDAAIKEAGEPHQWVQQFRQRERDEAASSSPVNRVVDEIINMFSGENAEESDAESDQTMQPETPSERSQPYLSSEICEVSDPEESPVLHDGGNSPATDDGT